jgi:surface antigen
MNMRSLKTLAIVMSVSLPLAACYGPDGSARPNQAIGTVSGALAGGLIGSAFGRGGGNVAATVAGAAIGGILGGAIGQTLDEADRERAFYAQEDAFSSGRRTAWRGDRGAYGYVEPGPAFDSGYGYCREYSHTIYIGGRPQQGYGTACREPDGSWRIVS